MSDPAEIRERLEREIDLIIGGGFGGAEPTTVVDLLDDVPHLNAGREGGPRSVFIVNRIS